MGSLYGVRTFPGLGMDPSSALERLLGMTASPSLGDLGVLGVKIV
jgi:hypothetical protein